MARIKILLSLLCKLLLLLLRAIRIIRHGIFPASFCGKEARILLSFIKFDQILLFFLIICE